MKLTPTQRIAVRSLAAALRRGFTWRETPQGMDYWQKVEENLVALDKKVPATCDSFIQSLTTQQKDMLREALDGGSRS